MAVGRRPDQVIDARAFWQAIGVRAVGAAVVAAEADDGPRGFLALSATHLSAEPPLLMVSVDKKTSALETILAARCFAISYLSAAQAELSDIFGGRSGLQGADRFGAAAWTRLATGAPALEGAVGVLDCRLEDVIDRGGAAIVLGRLVDFTSTDAPPLITFKGRTL